MDFLQWVSSQCPGEPPTLFLQRLADLATTVPPAPMSCMALTQIRVICATDALWERTTLAERAYASQRILDCYRRGGDGTMLPRKLHSAVCGHLLYRQRSGAFGGDLCMLRELIRCAKRDVEDFDMEKLSREQMNGRSLWLASHWADVIQFCAGEMGRQSVGGPNALACVRCVRSLLDLHRIHPTVIPLVPFLHFMEALIGQLRQQSQHLNEAYCEVAASYFSKVFELEVFQVREAEAHPSPPLVHAVFSACMALLPWLRLAKVCFLWASIIDRCYSFNAQLLAEENVRAIYRLVLRVFEESEAASPKDIEEEADDMYDSDGHSYLVTALGRVVPAAVHRAIEDTLGTGFAQLSPSRRNSVYRFIYLASHREYASMFPKLLSILCADCHPRCARRICNVIEGYAFYIHDESIFVTSLKRVLGIAAAEGADLTTKVHAMVAVRTLVEFHRLPIDGILRNIALPVCAMLCRLTMELMGSPFLISLVPLFSLLLAHLQPPQIEMVSQTLEVLWSQNQRNETFKMVFLEVREELKKFACPR